MADYIRDFHGSFPSLSEMLDDSLLYVSAFPGGVFQEGDGAFQ
jgi:hypothetical protein